MGCLITRSCATSCGQKQKDQQIIDKVGGKWKENIPKVKPGLFKKYLFSCKTCFSLQQLQMCIFKEVQVVVLHASS